MPRSRLVRTNQPPSETMRKRQRASRLQAFILPASINTRPISPAPVAHRPVCTLSTLSQTHSKLVQTTTATFASILLLLHPTPVSALTEPQKLVAEAWRVVDQSYVDRTFNHTDWFSIRMRAVKRAYASIEDGHSAIRDMLGLLNDPYTRFLSPQQFSSLTSSATGEVAGVGVEMFPARVDDAIKVTSPIDDSPAARAGVRASDIITLIDGETTAELTPDEAAARIRGRPGTSVNLTVIHDEGRGKEESFDMVRESLKLKSVKARLVKPGELYIKIKQFNSSTAGDMQEALRSFGQQNVERVILDLRNNPGGYFPAGVDVARLFMKNATPIVYVVDKRGIADEIDTVVDGMLTTQKMVVLVNKATASASEILAGALKDNERAKLVGEQTFGKGVVQTVSQLSDGSGLAVTVARYETPQRKDINKIGIRPDFQASCAPEQDVDQCIPDEAWR